MNEEEAKQKWCPHAFASHTDPRNGFQDEDETRTKTFPCIASKCMAWRWTCPVDTQGYKSSPHPPSGNLVSLRAKHTETEGYCGLSGAPS